MKSFLVLAILLTVVCVSVSASGAIWWYVDGSVSSSGDGTSWETAFKTIQEGIDASSDWRMVTVAKGVYVENIEFKGKKIVLTSTDPLDPAIVANTIIDGNQSGSVVTFSGAETQSCILSGFTIRNGKAEQGGGIIGKETRATIRNNIITGNLAYGEPGRGGGVHGCAGVIEGNLIGRNGAFQGGGLFACSGTIRNNRVLENAAVGMTYGVGWPPHFWSIDGNGGGLNACHGTIQGNLIAGNSAYHGGTDASCAGGALYECNGTIQNNLITNNWAEWHGGALDSCDGLIQNNTIVNNVTRDAGGILQQCSAIIRNCIIWGNTARYGALFSSTDPTHSCVQDWTEGGEGNIRLDPRFVNAGNGDVRLRPDSPCIDAGLNNPDLPELDIAGMHRIMFGGKSVTVDMGAYEFHIWPPTENVETGEMTLKWSSLAGRIYTVYYSGDMFRWDVLADDVASAGDTVTTWIDPPAPIFPPGVRIRYYKIAEKSFGTTLRR